MTSFGARQKSGTFLECHQFLIQIVRQQKEPGQRSAFLKGNIEIARDDSENLNAPAPDERMETISVYLIMH